MRKIHYSHVFFTCIKFLESLVCRKNSMETARRFQDLIIWQKTHTYVLKVYEYTNNFPRHELFGLSSQFRRSAVSIAANVAEGFRKISDKDKLRFFNIAQGSLEECRYYKILANDLTYGTTDNLSLVLDDTSRLLNGYCKGIIKRNNFENENL